jgi:hypothetical protein
MAFVEDFYFVDVSLGFGMYSAFNGITFLAGLFFVKV